MEIVPMGCIWELLLAASPLLRAIGRAKHAEWHHVCGCVGGGGGGGGGRNLH